MSENKISIRTAADCPEAFDRAVEPLTTRLVKETYDPPKTAEEDTRRDLKDILNQSKNIPFSVGTLRSLLSRIWPVSPKERLAQYMQRVRSAITDKPELQDVLRLATQDVSPNVDMHNYEAQVSRKLGLRTNLPHRLRNRLNHLRQKDRREIFVAMNGNEVVGMATYEQIPKEHLQKSVTDRLGIGDRPVFELGSVVVLPEFEKRGISRELRNAALDAIRRCSADAKVLSFSKNPIIHKKHENEAHKPIDLKDAHLLFGMEDSEEMQKVPEEMRSNKWQAYLFDIDAKDSGTESVSSPSSQKA